MGRRVKIVLLIAGLASVLAVCGYLALGWMAARAMLSTETSFERQNMTVKEARSCLSIPFPDEASDISFYGYSCWQAVHENLRFRAPPEVCLSYLTRTFDDCATSRPFTPSEAATTHPTKINLQDDSRFDPDPFRPTPGRQDSDRTWFNPHNIRNGVHAGGGSHIPEVWVDLDRGIFYCRTTD